MLLIWFQGNFLTFIPCGFVILILLHIWALGLSGLACEANSQRDQMVSCSLCCCCQSEPPAGQLNCSSVCVSCVGAYVCKGRSGWLMPLGEALCENADLQLNIPMKFKRAPPLPPPPGPAMCTLLLDMLASDPDARPLADQLESRVHSALKEDSHWHKVGYRDRNSYNHHSHFKETLTVDPLTTKLLTCVSNSHFTAAGERG